MWFLFSYSKCALCWWVKCLVQYTRSAGVKYKDQNKNKSQLQCCYCLKFPQSNIMKWFAHQLFFLNSQSHRGFSSHLLHSATTLISYHLPEFSFFLLDGFFSESFVGVADASSSSSASTLTRLGLLPSDSPEAKGSAGFAPLLAPGAARCQSELWNGGCCSTGARSSWGNLWGAVTRHEAEKSQ